MRLILTCLTLLSVYLFFSVVVKAQSVDVVVIVADVPIFTTEPYEVEQSTTDTPTNELSTLTFSAIAIDPESSGYYLIICKTNEVTENAGGAPTCPGGEWCVSDLTSNGNQAECDYSTDADDEESNDWYGFACGDGQGFCSDAYQGIGANGSPFYVNHAPSISFIDNNGSQDPGGTVKWTVEIDDQDSVGGNDSVKFFACKSDSFENGKCTDGKWCESGFTQDSTSCSYQIPDVQRDKLENAYIYVVDNHGLSSDSQLQGSDSSFSINNIAPTLSNITLNEGNDISLVAASTTSVKVSGAVSDLNSCTVWEIVDVSSSLYRSSLGYEACDQLSEADNNFCYPLVKCQIKDGESCGGGRDSTLEYECTFEIENYSDPTDSGTPFAEEDWKATLYVEDENGASAGSEVAVGVEVNTMISIETDPVIAYGDLLLGYTIDPLSKEKRIESSSNVGLDVIVYGTGLSNGNDYEIPVHYQRYADRQVSYNEAEMLLNEPRLYDINISKPTSGNIGKTMYWGITVPDSIPPGNYMGEVYLIGVRANTDVR